MILKQVSPKLPHILKNCAVKVVGVVKQNLRKLPKLAMKINSIVALSLLLGSVLVPSQALAHRNHRAPRVETRLVCKNGTCKTKTVVRNRHNHIHPPQILIQGSLFPMPYERCVFKPWQGKTVCTTHY